MAPNSLITHAKQGEMRPIDEACASVQLEFIADAIREIIAGHRFGSAEWAALNIAIGKVQGVAAACRHRAE